MKSVADKDFSKMLEIVRAYAEEPCGGGLAEANRRRYARLLARKYNRNKRLDETYTNQSRMVDRH